MLVFCFIVPFAILANPRTRTIAGTLVASISVNIGMWLERFTIVVPSLSNPRAPVHTFIYWPSWVEWSLMAGCFAAFTLLYMGFTKLFPIISIWELPGAGPAHAEPEPAAHHRTARPAQPLAGAVIARGHAVVAHSLLGDAPLGLVHPRRIPALHLVPVLQRCVLPVLVQGGLGQGIGPFPVTICDALDISGDTTNGVTAPKPVISVYRCPIPRAPNLIRSARFARPPGPIGR